MHTSNTSWNKFKLKKKNYFILLGTNFQKIKNIHSSIDEFFNFGLYEKPILHLVKQSRNFIKLLIVCLTTTHVYCLKLQWLWIESLVQYSQALRFTKLSFRKETPLAKYTKKMNVGKKREKKPIFVSNYEILKWAIMQYLTHTIYGNC